MIKVFIDGKEGTTGLRIFDRLSARDDINLLTLSDDERKNPILRRKMINSSDITFLCLPDEAAREAVALADNGNTRIIDTSTAHRTQHGWSYGFPELSVTHRENIIKGNRTAVPGCHASGFISLIYPLIVSGVLPRDYPVVCFSVTGYSGGGKKMIAEYESQGRSFELESPRQYGLTQKHKHLNEMVKICGLENTPIFNPVVADYYSGMAVTVPLFSSMLKKRVVIENIIEIYQRHYENSRLIKVVSEDIDMLSANKLRGRDSMEIIVSGNDERMVLSSRFDNLGKGASGAAVQCMNLMLGIDETTGLEQ